MTPDDVERYEQKYRGSEEEAKDLKELYTRFGGDMKQCVLLHSHSGADAARLRTHAYRRVFAWLCCSRPEFDSHRFMQTITDAVSKGAQ